MYYWHRYARGRYLLVSWTIWCSWYCFSLSYCVCYISRYLLEQASWSLAVLRCCWCCYSRGWEMWDWGSWYGLFIEWFNSCSYNLYKISQTCVDVLHTIPLLDLITFFLYFSCPATTSRTVGLWFEKSILSLVGIFFEDKFFWYWSCNLLFKIHQNILNKNYSLLKGGLPKETQWYKLLQR